MTPLAAAPTTAPTTGRPSAARWTTVAGIAYVSGWLAGLFVAPPAPPASADSATVHGYFLEHGLAILLQSLLVHALPGIALAVLALTVAAATRSTGRLRHGVIAAGVAAAVVSLTQVGFAVAAVATATGAADVTTQTLFHAINIADTVKLAALAGFVTTATLAARRAGMAPTWVCLPAAVLVPLLPVGGTAFLVDSPILTVVLTASLPLLLLWAAAITLAVAGSAS